MRTKAGIILLGQGEGIMKTKARIILLGLVMAIAFCYVTSVRAESNSAIGAAAASGGAGAAVNLDFQIVIPAFIYFQVGSSGAVVDQIQFAPTAAELEWAERIVTAFEENPNAGTIGMDGKMIDRPHLVQAKRIVELARQLAN